MALLGSGFRTGVTSVFHHVASGAQAEDHPQLLTSSIATAGDQNGQHFATNFNQEIKSRSDCARRGHWETASGFGDPGDGPQGRIRIPEAFVRPPGTVH